MRKEEIDFLEKILSKMPEHYYLTYRFSILNEWILDEGHQIFSESLGLDLREIRILRVINLMPGHPVAAIRRWCFLEKAVMSKALSSLSQKGLLKREISDVDARSILLFVTPSGQELLRKADVLTKSTWKKKFPSITPQKCSELMKIMDQLIIATANDRLK